jgi:hypothetical protein
MATKASLLAEELAAALNQLLQQVEQMKGMFPDTDGAIQNAVDDSYAALAAWRSALATSKES